MLYSCRECLFVFESRNKPDQCPDCGRYAVRQATDKEVSDYKDYQHLKDGGEV